MTKWTKTDVFLTTCTVLFSAVVGWVLAGLYHSQMLVFIPFVCTTVLAWLLKMRGKRLRFFAGLLAIFCGLLLIGGINLNATTKMVHALTGYYNAEAIGFGLLLPLLCGWGMLAGVGLGALLACLGRRIK